MQETCIVLSRLKSRKLILAVPGTNLYLLQHASRTQIRPKGAQTEYETILALKQQRISRKLGAGPCRLCNKVKATV